jgi:hypothetical protein
MSFLITAKDSRAREWDFTIYEDDGTTEVVLQADDVVRVKIGTNGEAPTLDLSSIDPDEITFTAGTGDCVLYLTESQVSQLGPGAWDCEVNVYDESENKLKHAETGVFFVHRSQLGAVGGEESSNSAESSSSSQSDSSSSSF